MFQQCRYYKCNLKSRNLIDMLNNLYHYYRHYNLADNFYTWNLLRLNTNPSHKEYNCLYFQDCNNLLSIECKSNLRSQNQKNMSDSSLHRCKYHTHWNNFDKKNLQNLKMIQLYNLSKYYFLQCYKYWQCIWNKAYYSTKIQAHIPSMNFHLCK
jgi:hypothetical protein